MNDIYGVSRVYIRSASNDYSYINHLRTNLFRYMSLQAKLNTNISTEFFSGRLSMRRAVPWAPLTQRLYSSLKKATRFHALYTGCQHHLMNSQMILYMYRIWQKRFRKGSKYIP